MSTLNPSKFTLRSPDKRVWSALHSSPSYRNAVAGGIFRDGVITGLNTRQIRSLVAAVGRSIVVAASDTGELFMSGVECEPERLDAFLAMACPGEDRPEETPEVATHDAPSEPKECDTSDPREDDEPAQFEKAKANDFDEREVVTLASLKSMSKSELEEWADARGVIAPAEDLRKQEQLDVILAMSGTAYEVKG